MQWLDTFLLDRLFQPICDALYEQIGDCIVIARFCFKMAIFVVGCAIGWRFGVTLPAQSPLILTAMFVTSQLYILSTLIYCLDKLRLHLGRRTANPLRIALFYPRVILVIVFTTMPLFCVMDSDEVIEIIRNISMVGGLYFASCRNRPPINQTRRFTLMHA